MDEDKLYVTYLLLQDAIQKYEALLKAEPRNFKLRRELNTLQKRAYTIKNRLFH